MEGHWIRECTYHTWYGFSLTEVLIIVQTFPSEAQTPSPHSPGVPYDPPLKFTSVMNNLHEVYPKETMDDISTSYCFICLLHLANEKGLIIDNEPGLEELNIRRDVKAEISEVDAL